MEGSGQGRVLELLAYELVTAQKILVSIWHVDAYKCFLKTPGIIVSSYLNTYLQIVRTIQKEEGSQKQSPHNDARS